LGDEARVIGRGEGEGSGVGDEFTTRESAPVTSSIPLSRLKPVAPATVQSRVTFPPPAGNVAGLAVNERICGRASGTK